MPEKLAPYLKAYAALIGTVVTALLGVYGDGQVAEVLTVIAAVCTAIGVWAVPNHTPTDTP